MSDDSLVKKRTPKPALTLERLRVFLKVLEAGGITKAAKRLGKKQGQVSFQMQELESYLGGKLFLRTANLPRTKAGEHLERITKDFLIGVGGVRQMFGQADHNISVGAGESTIRWVLLPKLPEFRRLLVTTQLTFEDALADVVTDKLLSGDLDLALLQQKPKHQSLEPYELSRFHFGVFARRDVAVKARRLTTPQILETMAWGLLERNTRVGRIMRDWFSNQGGSVQVQLVCHSNLMLAEAAKSLGMLTVLPLAARDKLADDGIALIEPTKELRSLLSTLSTALYLIWNKNTVLLKPSLEDVIAVFKKTLS